MVDSKKLQTEKAQDGVDTWGSCVYNRMINLTFCFLAAAVIFTSFPTRKGVGEIDSVVSVQFVIGPFLVSLLNVSIFYCIFWKYCKMHTFKEMAIPDNARSGNAKVWQITIPPYALIWRLLHVPIFMGIFIAAGGTKIIVQNILDQWLGLSGFNPIPSSLKVQSIPAPSRLDYFLNVTTRSEDFDSLASPATLWNFGEPKIWAVAGISTVLIFANLASFAAIVSQIKLHSDSCRGQNSISKSEFSLSRQGRKISEADWARSACTLIEEADYLGPMLKLYPALSLAGQNNHRRSQATMHSIHKTQSMLQFSPSNKHASIKSFSNDIRTPTPSISSTLARTSSKIAPRKAASVKSATLQMTALSNNDKFWSTLLETTRSRENSVGSDKDFCVRACSETYPSDRIPLPAATKVGCTAARRVLPTTSFAGHSRLQTEVSVSEEDSKAKECTANDRFKIPAPLAGVDHSRNETHRPSAAKRKTPMARAVAHLLANFAFAGAILCVVPAANISGPKLADLFGNFSNAIDNSPAVVIGSRDMMVKNAEAVAALCGCLLVLLCSCLFEELHQKPEPKLQ
ncbi:hypothetical protein HDU84_004635 [Entophlyctis sp. JEL0112]|nr:hypothetical protein HDU84_004635 [Entophlyctis sp. JEL0112]